MNQEFVLIAFQAVVLIFAFSIHECAHAWTAWRLGDPTARMLGRVTLNPLKHLDPVGSVILPLIAVIYHFPLIGWAKPTPVTPRNFRNYRRDDILTTVAGPLSNLLVALACLIGLVLLKHTPNGQVTVFSAVGLAQRIPGVDTTNLPPLFPIALLLYFGILINLALFVFNLIPIPPLDGSHVLRHYLPARALALYDRMGMFSLILFFLVGGRILGFMLAPIQNTFDSLLFSL